MKKYTLPLVFLALAAFLAFLAACGEGEPSNIATQWGPIQNAINDLTGESGPIAKCVGKEDEAGCAPFPQLPPSSVTDPDDSNSSSSTGGGQPPNSSPGEEQSSGSQQSSESTDPDEHCPPEIKDGFPNFACSWNTASVKSGGKATLTMTNTGDCTSEKARVKFNKGTSYYEGIAYFPLNTEIVTAGVYSDFKSLNNNIQWLDSEKSWPAPAEDKDTNFVVKGLLSCDISGAKYACLKECSALKIIGAKKPIASGNVSCPWTVLPNNNSNKYLSINADISGNCTGNVAITNNAEAECGEVSYKTIGATNAAGTVKGCAVATCRNTEYQLKCEEYTVVPNPSLGACTWTASGTTLTGSPLLTNAAKVIKPTVTLSNSHGRCKITGLSTPLSDGTLAPNVFSGTGADPWPTDGKLTITANTTYSDVKTKVDCTPTVQAVTCPTLTVNKGCTLELTTLNATNVTNGECFDVNYTATGSENNRANGMYVMCSTAAMSNSSCIRLLQYGSQMGMKSGSCNESGTNTVFNFLIQGSQNFASGKKFELEGIFPSVYVDLTEADYFDFECKVNDYSNGAVWTSQCNGATLVTIKPGVTLPSNSLAQNPGIQCKLNSGSATGNKSIERSQSLRVHLAMGIEPASPQRGRFHVNSCLQNDRLCRFFICFSKIFIIFAFMEKKELTAADVWAMFAETDKRMKETDRQMQETDRQMQETGRMIKELVKENALAKLQMEESTRKFYALHEEIGGISNSNGDFAEEFFYNSLEKSMAFADIHFDCISNKFARKRIMPDRTEVRAQFDIVLHNGNSIALIEAKYKANLKDIRELAEKKVSDFRFLYPEFASYKLYLGIGSLVLRERIVQEAKRLGVGLMRQKGDAVEYKTDWVRAY
jgi:hypothetical protein